MIVAGFGFRAAATPESLHAAYEEAGGQHVVSHLATLEDKAGSVAFRHFTTALSLPVIAVPDAAAQMTDTPTQSPASIDARGLGSVAEATALAALAPGGRIIVRRVVSADGMATCALAEGEIR